MCYHKIWQSMVWYKYLESSKFSSDIWRVSHQCCYLGASQFKRNRSMLTHWGQARWPPLWQTTFSSAFPWIKIYKFWIKFHWNMFLRWTSNWQYGGIASDIGLAPKRRQAIIWSNVGMLHWCIYATHGLNDVIHSQSRRFEILQDIPIKHSMGFWNRALDI